MKTLRMRLLIAFSVLYGVSLAGLGLLIGQLFPVYVENAIQSSAKGTETIIEEQLAKSNITLTQNAQQQLFEALPVNSASEELISSRWEIWLVINCILLILFIILMLITDRLLRNLTSSIDHVTHTTLELAKGNYRSRAYEASNEMATSQLTSSINVLARNLQDMMVTREIDQERLKTLIENMGSALIMIGREGNISIVNKTFLALFSYDHNEVNNRLFRDLDVSEELIEFVDHVFMTEVSYRKQIQMQTQLKMRHMEVYGAPVIGEHGHWLGVVIVMHDISELKQLEQIRKDFVANVSHELRTPITSVKGFSETLLDGAYKDEETLLAFLEIMNKESTRLQMLVNDLLELSKIEKHGFELDLTDVSLNELVMNVMDMYSLQLEEKNMAVQFETKGDVYIKCDPNRFTQVVVNLFVNAINYSPEHTTITIALNNEGGYGIFKIRDEGIGMAKEEVMRVFERFYRVDRARSRNSGGTGLGLAIVKHLIEAHHGRIEVESIVNEGTTITVYIPNV